MPAATSLDISLLYPSTQHTQRTVFQIMRAAFVARRNG